MNIKIEKPKVKHLKYFLELENLDLSEIKTKVNFLSKYLEIDKSFLYRIRLSELNNIFVMICEEIYKKIDEVGDKQPPMYITHNGKRYKFVEETKQSVGWMIDVNNLEDFSPEIILSLYYIEEEAVNYSEVNLDKSQKYDTFKRSEIFKDLDIKYFLYLSNYLKKKYSLILEMRMHIENIVLELENGLKR